MSFRVQMKANFGRRQGESASVDSPLLQDLGQSVEIPQAFRQRIRVLSIDPHLSLRVGHGRFGEDHGFSETSRDNL